ncbi:MAG: agmatinase [Anaerolineae bacterium]
MSGYTFLPPDNFLGLAEEFSAYERSRVVVLPIPYEATVSYSGGTRNGPRAILQASTQVELLDREFDDELALRWGVHTLPALAPSMEGPAAMVDAIQEAVAEQARAGKFVVGLGGEHTVSVGVARGLAQVFCADGSPLLTVQIDAHSDLRASYEDSTYSHACAARHFHQLGPLAQIGIRSVCREETDYIAANPETVRVFFAEEVHAGPEYLAELAEWVRGYKVFLTIDVDGIDPALIPATGTPEPGGLSWWQTLDVIRTVAQNADIVGFDAVELAPIPGYHAADFTVAKLVYKTLALALEGRQ